MAGVEVKERRIVVAVDESDESMYALAWCLQNLLPSHSQNTLILLNVRAPPPAYYSMDGTGFLFGSDVLELMEKRGKMLADSVMHRAKTIYEHFPNVKVEQKTGKGAAREVICSMVEKLGADILVMGSHGYGLIKRALIGSVSNHCAKHARCPVLIVKRPKN